MKDDRIKDFISCYKPPTQAKPFFGYLKMPNPVRKGKRKSLWRRPVKPKKPTAIDDRYNKYYDPSICRTKKNIE